MAIAGKRIFMAGRAGFVGTAPQDLEIRGDGTQIPAWCCIDYASGPCLRGPDRERAIGESFKHRYRYAFYDGGFAGGFSAVVQDASPNLGAKVTRRVRNPGRRQIVMPYTV